MATTRNKLLIATALAFLVIVALVVLVATNIDQIIKTAIEHYGSEALNTAVRVDSVSMELKSGKGTISGLTVAEPPGYEAPHAFRLESITIQIDPRSVTSSPVVIDLIHVASPQVIYELNESGSSNLDTLRRNIGSSTGNGGQAEGMKSVKRFRIRKLVIENGQVEIRSSLLGSKPRTVALPRIDMADIGGQRGATPQEIARTAGNALVASAAKQAAQSGAEHLMEQGMDRMMKRLQTR